MFIWSVRSVWFVWLHETNQMDQTDQACPRHADDWIAGGPVSFSTACYIEWVSSIRLQAETPGLEQEPVWCQQEQPEGLQA